MLSKYFEIKTKSESFIKSLNNLFEELKDKKVIIYGAGAGFQELNKTYKFNEKLNIVAIADKKFEEKNSGTFLSMKSIAPEEIKTQNFDYIIISNEYICPIQQYLEIDLDISEEKIKSVFVEEISGEQENLNYLYKMKFDKTLPKLTKKLKNKKVVLYGAGVFLELIKKCFNLSNLNIIAISDRRFENMEDNEEKEEEFLGYKTVAPSKIKDLNPDYVLVATKFYINIIEDLYYNTLKDTKIKIKPLLKKPFITLLREIWG